MWPCIGSALYGFGLVLLTVGTYAWQPYTGKGPPGTYVAPRTDPPAIAAVGPKIESRLVQVQSIKPPKVKVPSECRELAANADLPTDTMTQAEAREARRLLEKARQTKAVRRCREAIERVQT